MRACLEQQQHERSVVVVSCSRQSRLSILPIANTRAVRVEPSSWTDRHLVCVVDANNASAEHRSEQLLVVRHICHVEQFSKHVLHTDSAMQQRELA